MNDSKNPYATASSVEQQGQPQINQTQQAQGELVHQNTNVPVSAPANSGVKEFDGDVMDVTFDDEIKLNVIEKFPKLRKGEIVRFSFILFNGSGIMEGAPQIKMSNYFYDNISNSTILAPKNPNVLSMVIKALKQEPKTRFGTIVAKYRTDEYGNLMTDAANPQAPPIKLYALIFSTDKYPSFRNLHRSWGLQNHDVLVQCTDENFQKWDINIDPGHILKNNYGDSIPKIHQAASELYEKFLNKFMGKKYEDHELLSLLGLQGPGVGGPGVGGPQLPPQQNVVNPFPNQPGANVAPQVGQQGASEDFSHLVQGQEPNKE